MKEIPNTNELYFATDGGEVYSKQRLHTKGGNLKKRNSHGYSMVSLSVLGVRKRMKVCRLIAFAYHGVPSGKMQVNHINGDKADDRPINLEWVTPKENTAHAFRTGLRRAGKPKR